MNGKEARRLEIKHSPERITELNAVLNFAQQRRLDVNLVMQLLALRARANDMYAIHCKNLAKEYDEKEGFAWVGDYIDMLEKEAADIDAALEKEGEK